MQVGCHFAMYHSSSCPVNGRIQTFRNRTGLPYLEPVVAVCRHGRHIGQDPCVLRAQQFVSSSVWSKAMRERLHESLC